MSQLLNGTYLQIGKGLTGIGSTTIFEVFFFKGESSSESF